MDDKEQKLERCPMTSGPGTPDDNDGLAHSMRPWEIHVTFARFVCYFSDVILTTSLTQRYDVASP